MMSNFRSALLKWSSAKASTARNPDDDIYKRRPKENVRDYLFRVGLSKSFPEFKKKRPDEFQESLYNGAFPKRDHILHSIVNKLKDNPGHEESLLSLTEMVLDSYSGLVCHTNAAGDTALHRMAELGQGILVRAIHGHFERLENGPEVLLEAIGKTNNEGKTCLHIAIDKLGNGGDLSLLNTLIDLADSQTLGIAEKSLNHTVLHCLVDYKSCQIDKKMCEVENCQDCEIASYVTPRDFMQTLRKLVQKNPSVLKVLDVEGRCPYQYHLATVEKKKPTITSSENNESITPNHQSPEKVDSQDLLELVEDYLCKLQTRFMPQNPLSERTILAHNMLEFNSRLAIVDVKLQPLTSGIDSNLQDLVPAAMISRDAWNQRRKENADYLEAVLRWLKNKGVKQIIKLVVRDDKDGPCSDEAIERCLQICDIRYLDWNKEDLCIQTLLDGQAKNIFEISLYSSGKDSILWGWSSNDGLRRLEKVRPPRQPVLCRLRYNANSLPVGKGHSKYKPSKYTREAEPNLDTDRSKDGIETEERIYRNVKNFMKRVAEIPERQIEVEPHIYDPRVLKESSVKDQKIEESIQNIKEGIFTAQINEALSYPDIKVALLDDGVCPEHEELHARIEEGWPVDVDVSQSSTKTPFYTSDTGHGTAMAEYIQYVCPGVRIYVAKLDKVDKESQNQTQKQKSEAALAAEAVKWAIERKVHVISMSWTIELTDNNQKEIKMLETQIREAASKGIIMFCSGRDEAWNESSKISRPAACDPKVYRVGSSDPYGNMSIWVNPDSVDYLLPGEALLPGNKSRGSSASTALASGLAALIIWCFEATGNGTELVKKPEGMKKLLDSMVKGNKYLNVRHLLESNDPGNLNMAELVVQESKLRLRII